MEAQPTSLRQSSEVSLKYHYYYIFFKHFFLNFFIALILLLTRTIHLPFAIIHERLKWDNEASVK